MLILYRLCRPPGWIYGVLLYFSMTLNVHEGYFNCSKPLCQSFYESNIVEMYHVVARYVITAYIGFLV